VQPREDSPVSERRSSYQIRPVRHVSRVLESSVLATRAGVKAFPNGLLVALQCSI
jgi:hypothetical protein